MAAAAAAAAAAAVAAAVVAAAAAAVVAAAADLAASPTVAAPPRSRCVARHPTVYDIVTNMHKQNMHGIFSTYTWRGALLTRSLRVSSCRSPRGAGLRAGPGACTRWHAMRVRVTVRV